MGVCGCGSEEKVYKVLGNQHIIMSKTNDCPDCGAITIEIGRIHQDEIDSFHILRKKLGYWMDRGQIVISLRDFKSTIDRKIDMIFEDNVYDSLSDKEVSLLNEKVVDKMLNSIKRQVKRSLIEM